MKKIHFFFAFIFSTIVTTSYAGLIDVQQQRLKTLEAIWYKQNIPAGLATAIGMRTTRSSGASSSTLMARHVNFIFTDGIGFCLENLTASFVPLNPMEPVNLDDPTQFIIRVHTGTVIVSPHALSALFNKQILDFWPRPLNNMRISTARNFLGAQAGLRLWSWIPPIFWVPAYLGGTIVLNQQKLVYTPYDVRALGIPLAGFFNALGIKLSYLLTLNREGAVLIGNSLILDHTRVFPPPAIEGYVTDATLDENGLRLTFNDGTTPTFTPPASAHDSFIWIQSGDVKIFNTVVLNANVLIQNEDAQQGLTFDLYHYRQQIAAHNRVTMGEDGSIVLMI